jgi:HK97 family phage prohead protease
MDKSFSFIIPLRKDGSNMLTGIASTTSVDRDSEKMSIDALKRMAADIKTKGVNLFGNHEHNWENTLGVINDADIVDNQVQIRISLDNPDTNDKIPMLLNKLAAGIKLGLSVGGNVQGYSWEYDRTVGKKIKVLDDVSIYEVSVVGIPSNAESFLTIPQAIAKSAKLPRAPPASVSRCPICWSDIFKGVCQTCLTPI